MTGGGAIAFCPASLGVGNIISSTQDDAAARPDVAVLLHAAAGQMWQIAVRNTLESCCLSLFKFAPCAALHQSRVGCCWPVLLHEHSDGQRRQGDDNVVV